jgi:hypothetical protein
MLGTGIVFPSNNSICFSWLPVFYVRIFVIFVVLLILRARLITRLIEIRRVRSRFQEVLVLAAEKLVKWEVELLASLGTICSRFASGAFVLRRLATNGAFFQSHLDLW